MFSIDLWIWSLAIGAATLLLGLFLAFSPAAPDSPLSRFPRNLPLGYAMCAIAFVWAGWVLHAKPLEFLLSPKTGEMYKWVWPAMIAAIPLACVSMKDLLPCRALGGLFCLLPAPVLQIARFHPSPMRLAVIVYMYVLAVAGMVFLMNPYHLRDAISWLSARQARQRAAGCAFMALGMLLAILGPTVFK